MLIKITAAILLLIALQGVLGAPEESIRRNANKFSTSLLNVSSTDRDTNKNKNLCLSGFSTYLLMLMMYNGAGGQTEDQLQTGLFLKNSSLSKRETMNTDQKNLIEKMTSRRKSKLLLANKIFLDNSVILKPEFKNIIETNFKSVPENVDFEEPINASNIINSWIDKNTNSSITHVVNPDDFSSDTKVVLINTIHFISKWKYQFDDYKTTMEPFNLENGITKNVPTMKRRMLCKFGPLSGVDADFIILPFEDEDTVMMIVLPEEKSEINDVLKNLYKVKRTKILREFPDERFIDVFLPKFKIETETNLVEPIKKLGMTDMFLNTANFSGISDVPLAVGKIIQKVSIEVNEKGTSASGATALSLENRSMVDEYKINRPFLFFIIQSGTVIFNGMINDPSTK